MKNILSRKKKFRKKKRKRIKNAAVLFFHLSLAQGLAERMESHFKSWKKVLLFARVATEQTENSKHVFCLILKHFLGKYYFTERLWIPDSNEGMFVPAGQRFSQGCRTLALGAWTSCFPQMVSSGSEA